MTSTSRKERRALSVFIAALLAGCASPGGSGRSEEPKTLAADSIAVREILRPQAFLHAGDRVAVQTLEDTVFYVYGLPDFDLLYTFGRRGGGPDEFTGLTAEQTGRPGVFSVRTYRGGIPVMELYRAGDTAAEKVAAYHDRGFDPNFRMACTAVDDSLLVGAFIGLSPQKRHSLRLVDLRDGEVKDSLTDFYEYTIPFAGRENIGRNTARIAVCGRRFAVAYEESQTLEFYEIKDGRFRHTVSVGRELSPAKESFDPDPRKGRLAYVDVFADAERVYAVNARTDIAALERGEGTDVVLEVYGWNGRAEGVFRLDRKNRLPVLVDGVRRTVYAVDPAQDFDRIYTYRF